MLGVAGPTETAAVPARATAHAGAATTRDHREQRTASWPMAAAQPRQQATAALRSSESDCDDGSVAENAQATPSAAAEISPISSEPLHSSSAAADAMMKTPRKRYAWHVLRGLDGACSRCERRAALRSPDSRLGPQETSVHMRARMRRSRRQHARLRGLSAYACGSRLRTAGFAFAYLSECD